MAKPAKRQGKHRTKSKTMEQNNVKQQAHPISTEETAPEAAAASGGDNDLLAEAPARGEQDSAAAEVVVANGSGRPWPPPEGPNDKYIAPNGVVIANSSGRPFDVRTGLVTLKQDTAVVEGLAKTDNLLEQTPLRCAWILGCPVEIHPKLDAKSLPENSIPTAKHIYSQAFGELFPGVNVPSQVGVPCCSQFGVTRETVRARPKEDYIRFREWLLNTDLHDAISGRVFEYAWHIMFNKEPVHCPHAGDCYCKQYGMCHRLDCGEESCPGQYDLPRYSTLPKGWPVLGWDGEDRHWSGEL
ncbi:hypothetical protein NLG97_g7594 [Lecanicillium saksenae]|uniref:Uncharacterized protein n=1 Tax=Lecanicillium saksenae TaxID=468837 RepID=A0ACC1QPK5_9HYPO|nr:hypothetical protein NLG97_g7594 [Lecanicillium saksenae]